MSKLKIYCVDKIIEDSFDSVKLFTKHYNVALQPKTLHSPKAAKIIITKNDLVSIFLFEQPIIHVLDNMNVFVWTRSKYAKVILDYNEQKKLKDNYLLTKIKNKILKAKSIYNLDIIEILNKSIFNAEMEVFELIKNNDKYKYEGGWENEDK